MELWHYGVKGMKWGVRNYQNKDGSWTNLGKERRKAKRNLVDEAHSVSTRHLETRNLPKTNKELARIGEYWYNQNGELLATMKLGITHPEDRNYRIQAPNTVVEYMEAGTKQVNRILHDSNGVMAVELHGGPHGGTHGKAHLKREPPEGIHAHDHDEQGRRVIQPQMSSFRRNKANQIIGTKEYTDRPLTWEEEKENRAAFRRK